MYGLAYICTQTVRHAQTVTPDVAFAISLTYLSGVIWLWGDAVSQREAHRGLNLLD